MPHSHTTTIDAAIDSALDSVFSEMREAGFGYGSKASGFVNRKGGGFGGKKRRKAFFAKMKDKYGTNPMRFRAPSAQTAVGGTTAKKRAMKLSGGKAALQAKRKPLQAKRFVLRRGKYYSYASKAGRLGNPRFLGI